MAFITTAGMLRLAECFKNVFDLCSCLLVFDDNTTLEASNFNVYRESTTINIQASFTLTSEHWGKTVSQIVLSYTGDILLYETINDIVPPGKEQITYSATLSFSL